ncbi:MAG: hypothetical protein KAQ90_01675, partial [Melioribacteraceae bacterium]|nr:hypothetical protein [Melioribacteraceae bacterium]
MRTELKLIVSLLILWSFNSLIAQEKYNIVTVNDTLLVNLDNIYKISTNNIVPLSESLTLGNKVLKTGDYIFNYRSGHFNLSDSFIYSLSDTIYLSFRTVLIDLKNEYSRRSLIVQYDEQINDSIRIIKNDLRTLSSESIFGSGINQSGSISRGFTIGSNQDFRVNSGLRLQFSGKLSDDLEIVAALTDENVPIQAEGTTERLEELDKVFIKVKHKNAAATFGDFEMTNRVGEFGRLNRKMVGLEGELFTDPINGKVVLAGSKGKFNTNQFLGIDGNQGPYRLQGINNEQAIIIIAGTETVYIDGEVMK